MKDIQSILITIIGIVLFITLLPTLLWLALIVAALVAVFVIYSRFKYKRYMKDVEKEFENAGYTQNTSSTFSKKDSRIKPDVIDVEYTEHEEDSQS